MKSKRLVLLVLLLSSWSLADSHRGLKPRAKPSDYPVVQRQNNVTIAAEQLSKRQVHNSFASDLNRGFVVVEVGLFPQPDASIQVSPDQFVLRVAGSNSVIRPAAPETIARVLQKKSDSNDVVLHPTATIGYETGGRDPYGNRYPGGLTTGVGVIGGRGAGPTANTPADRTTMERELRDKSLPEGKADKSVAGYIYFPVTSRKIAAYDLEYTVKDQVVRIHLPKPAE
jgi:hypothetical protein